MRKTLLASAAVFGLALGAPAFAQTTPAPATPPMGNMPAAPATPSATDNTTTDQSQPPMKMPMRPAQASNIGPADTHSTIAPALPVPAVGPNATPQQYLQQAQQALHRRRSGEAQEALERAETRMLDRSTEPSAANQPDMAPAIQQVTKALDALGRRDWHQADQIIADLLNNPNMAANGNDEMGGGMNGGMAPAQNRGMNGSMPMGGSGGIGSGPTAPPPPGTPPGAPGGTAPMQP
jgi:hypothetical protein